MSIEPIEGDTQPTFLQIVKVPLASLLISNFLVWHLYAIRILQIEDLKLISEEPLNLIVLSGAAFIATIGGATAAFSVGELRRSGYPPSQRWLFFCLMAALLIGLAFGAFIEDLVTFVLILVLFFAGFIYVTRSGWR